MSRMVLADISNGPMIMVAETALMTPEEVEVFGNPDLKASYLRSKADADAGRVTGPMPIDQALENLNE